MENRWCELSNLGKREEENIPKFQNFRCFSSIRSFYRENYFLLLILHQKKQPQIDNHRVKRIKFIGFLLHFAETKFKTLFRLTVARENERNARQKRNDGMGVK